MEFDTDEPHAALVVGRPVSVEDLDPSTLVELRRRVASLGDQLVLAAAMGGPQGRGVLGRLVAHSTGGPVAVPPVAIDACLQALPEELWSVAEEAGVVEIGGEDMAFEGLWLCAGHDARALLHAGDAGLATEELEELEMLGELVQVEGWHPSVVGLDEDLLQDLGPVRLWAVRV